MENQTTSLPVSSQNHSFHLANLSDEQRAVVKAVACEDQNAIVNAVAGSGKTRTAITTALEWLQRRASTSRVLLIAYNKRLQEDMQKQRAAVANFDHNARTHIDIRTIHGLGHHYFGGKGLTKDGDLVNWTSRRARPRVQFPNFGLVIIDEAQDLTPVLFDFLHFILQEFLHRPQVLVVGDPFQLLYRFNGADESFILDADEKFRDVAADKPFQHFKLSICFRISHEMAAWINENLNPNNLSRAIAPYAGWWEQHREKIAAWWGHGIRANPNREPEPDSVTYFMRVDYTGPWLDGVVDKIVEVFEKFDTANSALLSPSITQNERSPVRLITNRLKEVNGAHQSWFIDDKNVDVNDPSGSEDVRRNKRVASTIHKFKGRERDAIVVVGLDAFPEQIEKKNPLNLFNMFYVAATRACRKLLIVQWSEPAYATHKSRSATLSKDEQGIMRPYEVTRALDYCPYDATLCEESPKCLSSRQFASCDAAPLIRDDYIVRGSHHAKRQRTMENVSSVIGIAVEVRLQLLLDDGRLQMPFTEGHFESEDDHRKDIPEDLVKFVERMRKGAATRTSYSWAEVLEIATALLTLADRLYSRWRQISDFTSWPIVAIQSDKLDSIVRNLVHLLYLPFCANERTVSQQKVDDVTYEQKLLALKKLRSDGRILLNEYHVEFDMTRNESFALQYSPVLAGQPDITLISAAAAEKYRRAKNGESTGYGRCCSGGFAGVAVLCGDATIVEVKTTSKTSHDHLLQVGCYGSMWRKQRIEGIIVDAKRKHELHEPNLINSQDSVKGVVSTISQQKSPSLLISKAHNKDAKSELSERHDESHTDSGGRRVEDGDYEQSHLRVEEENLEQQLKQVAQPNMFVAYPNLGLLNKLDLHMDTYEFLHRIGFRKVNEPFDQTILQRDGKA